MQLSTLDMGRLALSPGLEGDESSGAERRDDGRIDRLFPNQRTT